MKREHHTGVPGPVTLGDLASAGKLLWCWCSACGRERDLEPASLPLPMTYPVPDVGTRMVCSACGSRKVRTAPELYPGGIVAQRARWGVSTATPPPKPLSASDHSPT